MINKQQWLILKLKNTLKKGKNYKQIKKSQKNKKKPK
jgi:hypothetical protein